MSVKIKSDKDIALMIEGGKILGNVKSELIKIIKAGISAYEVDKLAESLIQKAGAKESFKMVEGYHWTTCINVNQGVVHGIPGKDIIFKKGDIVSVDLGVYYKGFHTDSSFSLGIEVDKEKNKFLQVGKQTLINAINKAKAGNYVFDISDTIGKNLIKSNYNPIIGLVGHGVGRQLHEDPSIPCFAEDKRERTHKIEIGNVFAIEIMYTTGSGNIKIGKDGWTISVEDDKISALFEDTVAITRNGPLVLTDFQIL